jgi:hypothetical protein
MDGHGAVPPPSRKTKMTTSSGRRLDFHDEAFKRLNVLLKESTHSTAQLKPLHVLLTRHRLDLLHLLDPVPSDPVVRKAVQDQGEFRREK